MFLNLIKLHISRTVFFKDNWLSNLKLRDCVVLNPLTNRLLMNRCNWQRRVPKKNLRSPFRGLAPPIRVQVESTIVDGVNLKLLVEIATVAGRVCPIWVSGEVELSLSTGCNQVVGVDRLDELGNVLDPGGHHLSVTSCRTGKVADAVGTTARLIGELPGHDGGRVLVSADKRLDVVFIGVDNLGNMVELWNRVVSEGLGRDQERGSPTSSWYFPPRLMVETSIPP